MKKEALFIGGTGTISMAITRALSKNPECQIEDPEFDAWCDKVIAAQEEAVKKVVG